MILRHLAESGPLNKYRICKDLAARLGMKSPNTILNPVLELERQRLIHVDHSDPARGRDRSSNYYDLTPTGVMMLLSRIDCKKDAKLFTHLADKYLKMGQEVFDVWPVFESKGLDELARKRLQILTTELIRYMGNDDIDSELNYWFWDSGYFLEKDRNWTRREEQDWRKGVSKIPSLRERAIKAAIAETTQSLFNTNEYLKTLGISKLSGKLKFTDNLEWTKWAYPPRSDLKAHLMKSRMDFDEPDEISHLRECIKELEDSLNVLQGVSD